jgi:hypothetical protein
MRFFVGALALAVICVLFGSPAAFVLGWSPLSAGDRQKASSVAAKPVARAEVQTERKPAS